VGNLVTNRYDTVKAKMLVEKDNCIIYAETNSNGESTVTQEQAEALASEYEENIHSQITGAFGAITHMTDTNKVTFLLVDIKDGYNSETGGGYVAGFFSSTDMLTHPASNKRDMLYIDTDPGLKQMSVLYATVAHELQHLINYSNTTFVNGGIEVDLWINEGLSTAAEYVYGGDPSDRVRIFNLDPYKTIQRGNNFFIWNGYWEQKDQSQDVLADYSTAYLFFQWLRLHASNDKNIYLDIISNAAAGITDYQAVTKAVRERIPAMGLASDTDWATLQKNWLLANWIQSETGILGYKNKISEITRGKATELTRHGFQDSEKNYTSLWAGEGIFTEIASSTYTLPDEDSGEHIRYVGISESGEITDASPGYTGQYLLTFNANSDNTSDSDEKGYLADPITASILSSKSVAGSYIMPKSWPIDAGVLLARRGNNVH
jgi:hypothetical protein